MICNTTIYVYNHLDRIYFVVCICKKKSLKCSFKTSFSTAQYPSRVLYLLTQIQMVIVYRKTSFDYKNR